MNNHDVLRSYREALALIERKALAGDEATMALLAPAAVLLRDAIDKLQEEIPDVRSKVARRQGYLSPTEGWVSNRWPD